MSRTNEYWDAPAEALSRDELSALQLQRLIKTIEQISLSPFYQARFREGGITPSSIRTLEDIRRLPLTTKTDLRNQYPYGLLCVEREKLVRLHVSSGTTGQATAVFYSRHDVDHWADLMARCMYMTGARPGDTFQNLTGYGLFTGGLGFHYGSERLGLLTIPSGAGNSKRQIQLMQDFSTTIFHIIPSYALRLMDIMTEMGMDPKRDLSLRIAYLGAEPYSEEVRRRVEDFYGIDVYNSYGLSEMNGPGVAFECPYKCGMHIWEDAYFVEIIDPETLEPVPDGTLGELVLTTLNREAMPIIRYRSKDLTSLIPDTCSCGRTHMRIERITGRSDDMMILKGVNIFPMQIESVLHSIPGVGRNYLIILEQKGHNDHMVVRVEIDPSINVDAYKSLEQLRSRIARELRDEILITPEVDLCEPGKIPVSEGKAVRVIDNRKL